MRQLLIPASLALLLGACGPAPVPAPVAPAADPASPSVAPDTRPADEVVVAHFRCGDLAVGARFDNARGELVLTPAARRLVLPQAPAASGARYADAQGNEFWNKGQRANLTLDGARLDCAVTGQVSSWDEARSRPWITYFDSWPFFADGAGNYQNVMDAMALLQNAGVERVGLMSQPRQDGAR